MFKIKTLKTIYNDHYPSLNFKLKELLCNCLPSKDTIVCVYPKEHTHARANIRQQSMHVLTVMLKWKPNNIQSWVQYKDNGLHSWLCLSEY